MFQTKATLLSTLILSMLWTATGLAQLINHAQSKPEGRQLYLEIGLSPAVMASLGLIHPIWLRGHALGVSGEFGVGAAEADLDDYRVRIGLESRLLKLGSLGLALRARGVLKGTHNDIYEARAVGAELTALAGLYRPSWLLLAEGNFDRTFATHVENSDWYRNNFYAGARDGWYGGTAGTWYLGVAAQKSLGRLDLSLRLGKRWTMKGLALVPPMQGTLAFGWRF